MTEEISFNEKLLEIQAKLKAPKGQFNKFGKYNYRSQEDILEAVKPLNKEYGLFLRLSDEPVLVGDWHYIQAKAILEDAKSGEYVEVDSYAREPLNKKGMDESQITGTASSYARKYALNGLYLIDDTKDADTNEHHDNQQNMNNQNNSQPNPQQQNFDDRSAPQEPQQTSYKPEPNINDAILTYVKQLKDLGINVQQLYVEIAQKEGANDIKEVDRARTLGHMKAYLMSVESQQQPQQNYEQGSMMQGRTTQPVNWGNK
ncbi:ERF family protein [Carnobacterium jeotgali]|uniref:ERF family protein n=1 Tax=Carnobacterium jeotgali TaxID=545534 RepID=UPI00068EF338|nr:ERF family protein [Carnobacterium jeotgali]